MYREAAAKGEPEAMYKVAQKMLGGEDEMDTEGAKEMLEKAAANGCPQAIREIG